MSIIKELRDGTVKISVNEDGSEAITRLPPTALSIRAANTIASLNSQLEGLARAYQSLELQFNRNIEEFQKLYEKCSMVSEHVASEGIDSVRPVHGDAKDSRNETETG